MPLVYVCDYCQQPIGADEPHYSFAVQRRIISAAEGGGGQLNEVPVVGVVKTRVYILHGRHFDDDAPGLATALYSDFNAPPPAPADPASTDPAATDPAGPAPPAI